MSKTFYFVRHGQTEWNAIRRMQGQWESDLTALGREQAAVNAALLQQFDIEALYASPLRRTRQTAEIIQQKVSTSVTYDDRLKEWDSGEWSGYLYEEIVEKWPDEWAAWRADVFNYRGPNCENFPDMVARTKPFLEEVLTIEASTIAIISHGMIGAVMISILLELEPQQVLQMAQPNDVIIRLQQQDKGWQADHFIEGEGPAGGLYLKQADPKAVA
jgi:broad specificity phosphatase PhoE